MGKLYKLRRAIHKNPEAWYSIHNTKGRFITPRRFKWAGYLILSEHAPPYKINGGKHSLVKAKYMAIHCAKFSNGKWIPIKTPEYLTQSYKRFVRKTLIEMDEHIMCALK